MKQFRIGVFLFSLKKEQNLVSCQKNKKNGFKKKTKKQSCIFLKTQVFLNPA